VVASLFVGIATLGDVRQLGRIGGRTLAWFLGTTVIAATIGLLVALVSGVGRGASVLPASGATAIDTSATLPGFGQTLIDMVPQNLFGAAARGDLLPLIVAVCLFASAATVLSDDRRRVLLSLFEAINDISMIVVRWLMYLAPLAVLVLVAETVATSGLDLLASLAGYALVVIVGMLIHLGAVLLPAIVFGTRRRIGEFVRAVSDALTMAFSTASSNVTLPISMRDARERLGLPEDVVGFVLPAGATLNKNGAAVYKAVTAVFLAHLYGIDLNATLLITIVAMSTVAAFAGAGVPGSSLVTTLLVLDAIGLGAHAAAGIALVTGIDRPLDMCRTALNTFGNLVGTTWVARGVVAAIPASRPLRSEG
jgi:Na+/H+-dicarboxylate symporter